MLIHTWQSIKAKSKKTNKTKTWMNRVIWRTELYSELSKTFLWSNRYIIFLAYLLARITALWTMSYLFFSSAFRWFSLIPWGCRSLIKSSSSFTESNVNHRFCPVFGALKTVQLDNKQTIADLKLEVSKISSFFIASFYTAQFLLLW